MTVDELNGVPQVYTAELSDQTSDEYKAKRDEVVPLIESSIRRTTFGSSLSAITDVAFSDGSLIVDYAVSLREQVPVNRVTEELDTALQESPMIAVKENSLNVAAGQLETTTPRNVIATTSTPQQETSSISKPSDSRSTVKPSTGVSPTQTVSRTTTRGPTTPVPEKCPMLMCGTLKGTLSFPATVIGHTAHSDRKCFCGNAMATLYCQNVDERAMWTCDNLIISTCDEGEVNQQLLYIDDQCVITDTNLPDILQKLQTFSTDSNLRSDGIQSMAHILRRSVSFDSIDGNSMLARTAVTIVNNLIKADELSMQTSQQNSGSLIQLITTLEIILKYVSTAPDGVFSLVTEEIGIDIREVTKAELRNGLQFSSYSDDVINLDVGTYSDKEVSASIRLPSSLADLVFAQGVTSHRLVFALYRSPQMFLSANLWEENRKNDLYQTLPCSQVIAASVKDQVYTYLEEPVKIRFQLNSNTPSTNAQCVFWDFKADNGRGDWSTDGCDVVIQDGDHVVCRCNHLTNFAVLTDVYKDGNKPAEVPDNPNQNQDWRFLVYIGCVLIVIAVLMVYFKYFLTRALLTNHNNMIRLSICTALLGLSISFIVVIVTDGRSYQSSIHDNACIIVTVLFHYFTLVTAVWTAVQSLYNLLQTFRRNATNKSFFVIIASFVAWVVPLIVVLAAVFINQLNYTAGKWCFPQETSFFATLLAPLGFILILNVTLHIATFVKSSYLFNKNNTSGTSVNETIILHIILTITFVAGYLATVGSLGFGAKLAFTLCSAVLAFFVAYVYVLRSETPHVIDTSNDPRSRDR